MLRQLTTHAPLPLASGWPRVLLVDDDERVLISLRRVLEADGYDIFTSTSAKLALELMEVDPVDVVVSDHHMPGMSGLELSERLCRGWPDTVRVMLTGVPGSELGLTALERGSIFRFLTKPWSERELRGALRQAVAHRQNRIEARRLLATLNRRTDTQLDTLVGVVAGGFGGTS
jgi:response regulator RpfG family c-di-GMP phosphodiesterase